MADRVERIKTIIGKNISDIIQFELRNPKIGFCTVKEVWVSADFSYARVYVTFLGTKYPHQNLEELNKCKGYVRSSLTNELVTEEVANTRPIAVMIPNDSWGGAQDRHYGLQRAYLVYEIIAEGNITRFEALFKDQDIEKIGPVRSSRHYYLDYVMENDAIYVHYGWSPQAQEDIKTLNINMYN